MILVLRFFKRLRSGLLKMSGMLSGHMQIDPSGKN